MIDISDIADGSRGDWETFVDHLQLNEANERVLYLMSDFKWHTPDEINLAAGVDGVPAREGLRRLRELRKYFTIETQRVKEDKRLFIYKLNPEYKV
jgi:hypothetical protein